MPQDRIPIRCNKYCPSALLHDAERFEENAADVGDVLCDLRADNGIKRSIGWASCVASPIAYESHFGGLRRLHDSIRSFEISMPTTAPSPPTISAMLSHKKPGPQPTSSTRSPRERASRLMVSARCATISLVRYWLSSRRAASLVNSSPLMIASELNLGRLSKAQNERYVDNRQGPNRVQTV